jgi:hypothetical protein
MAKYRKKPVVIDAIQWHGNNAQAVGAWAEGFGPLQFTFASALDGTIALSIPTLEGVMHANRGDWIIRGVYGEFYPCKADIFEATYEMVETPSE